MASLFKKKNNIYSAFYNVLARTRIIQQSWLFAAIFLQCGRLVIRQPGLRPASQSQNATKRLGGKIMWSIPFVCWTVPLHAPSISQCVCLSHRLQLSLLQPPCAPSSVTCYTLTFFPPASLTICFILVCMAVFQYLHFKFPWANVVRLSQSGCLSVFFSHPHFLAWSLAAFLVDPVSASISLSL